MCNAFYHIKVLVECVVSFFCVSVFKCACVCVCSCVRILLVEQKAREGGRGHMVIYYTSPQSLKIMFSYSLKG